MNKHKYPKEFQYQGRSIEQVAENEWIAGVCVGALLLLILVAIGVSLFQSKSWLILGFFACTIAWIARWVRFRAKSRRK